MDEYEKEAYKCYEQILSDKSINYEKMSDGSLLYEYNGNKYLIIVIGLEYIHIYANGIKPKLLSMYPDKSQVEPIPIDDDILQDIIDNILKLSSDVYLIKDECIFPGMEIFIGKPSNFETLADCAIKRMHAQLNYAHMAIRKATEKIAKEITDDIAASK